MIKKLFSFFVVIITAIGFVASINAEQMLVDVTPVFPMNQDPEVKNYFSIHTDETHFEQEIEFMISNSSEEKVTIQMEALNALNSPQKGIQYSPYSEENNTRLLDERYALANYIEIEEEITLAGGETKRIQTLIDIPELDGTILGAVSFKTLDKNEEENEDQLMIHNKLNRIIGIQINKETDEKAEFVFHDPYIEPMSAYYVIRFPVELKSSLLMKDVLLEYEVLDDENNILFASKDEAPFNIAPNTYTEYSLQWQHDILEESKDYQMNGVLKYEDQTVEFNKVFEYNEAKFNAMKQNEFVGKPDLIKKSSSYGWILFTALLIVLGGAIFFGRNQTRKKRND